MNNLQQEQNIEKYRELYEYSRDMHFKQIERANRIDQKAAMFLSALTVLIGFAGFFLKASIEIAIPPEGSIEYIFLGSTILSCVTVVGSWFSFLLVLRIRNLENLRLDSQILDFFKTNRRVDVHYAISNRASEAYSVNDLHIASKLRRLTCGYLFAIVGVVLIAGSLIIFGYMKWVNPDPKPHERTYKVSLVDVKQKGGKKMTDETKGGSEQQQTDSGTQDSQSGSAEQLPIDQPNIDVQAPKNVIQTEAVDYSKITTRDAGKSESKSE